VVIAASFYRSIDYWAVNAWDISSPAKVLLVAGAVAAIGIALLFAIRRLGREPLPIAIALGGLILLLSFWQQVEVPVAYAVGALVLLFGWVGQKTRNSVLVTGLGVAMVVALGLMPLVQLAWAHIEDARPYSLVRLAQPVSAAPSGVVEDVVLIIVDTYPNLDLASAWFGHDPTPLVDGLESNGFTVETDAWSRHTFTALSVSSILQLHSVIEPGPTGSWGNRSSLFEILRGNSFVSRTLQSAGFDYTHIESGWDATACGPNVDRCLDSPWLDEQVFGLLSPTIASGWAQDRHHFLTGTFNTAELLKEELAGLTGNGSHDYLFAHFLLPHAPFLVDARCDLKDDLRHPVAAQLFDAISEQMACVDLMLREVTAGLDEDTAVLLTGDHGTTTGDQVLQVPDEWSDADIAERFGVLLAHKSPQVCPAPSLPDPVVAMSAIMSCALDQTFSPPPPEYLIGAEDPEAVAPARMARIKDQVAAGLLPPDAGGSIRPRLTTGPAPLTR
jgi:hypothetical protein